MVEAFPARRINCLWLPLRSQKYTIVADGEMTAADARPTIRHLISIAWDVERDAGGRGRWALHMKIANTGPAADPSSPLSLHMLAPVHALGRWIMTQTHERRETPSRRLGRDQDKTWAQPFAKTVGTK